MTYPVQDRASETPCAQCPLRKRALFAPFTDEVLAFTERLKKRELRVKAGTALLTEGSGSPRLYTVLNGMGLRFKTLPDGARQVLNFVLPGDFLGLQSVVMGEMKHSVSASTPMTLCVFDRTGLWDLFQHQPQRAYDVTWLAAVEEHFLGDALASVGQRSGIARLAWALLRLHARLTALGLAEGASVPLPFRQHDLADALGMSLVHTNKSLQKLRGAGLLSWSKGRLSIPDPARLAAFAELDSEPLQKRPLI